MIEITGKYGTAKIFNDYVEDSALKQVNDLMNNVVSKNAHVRFQSDIHMGAGATIGTTMKLTDKIVPNLVSVDINCGMACWKIKNKEVDFQNLDDSIRKNVPSGRNVRDAGNKLSNEVLQSLYNHYKLSTMKFLEFLDRIKEICERTNQNYNYVIKSIGTLGGGK